jgi:tetratricopeptide (TPR) repeat protein
MVNYGASLARAGKENAALDWSVRAIEAFGPHVRWDELMGSASNNLLVSLIRKRRIVEARAELERLRPGLTVRAARELDSLVGDAELTAAAEGSDFASALRTVAAAKAAGIPDPPRVKEIEVYVWLKETGRIAEAEGWASAIIAVDRALAAVGPDKRIAEALRVYRINRMAELHNIFVAFYNAGRYQEAKDAAVAALREFPGESRLKTDLNSAEKALLR